AAPTATVAPPVPLPEVARRGDETAVYLRQVEERLKPGDTIGAIETELPGLTDRLTLLQARTTRVLEAAPSLRIVAEISAQWRALQDLLTDWDATLTERSVVLEKEMAGLAELREVWKATRDLAQAQGAPPAVFERIKATSHLIAEVRKGIETHRQALLVLQERVVQEAARCRDTLDQLGAYRQDAVGRLLTPDGAPLWARERWDFTSSEAVEQLRTQAGESITGLRDYLVLQLARVPLQLLLFVALFAVWRKGRQRTAGWVAEDETIGRIAVVFEHPASAALLLALLASPWIYPQAPIQLVLVVRIACVPVLLRVLDRLVDRPLLPGLYVLGGFFVSDQVRQVLATLPRAEEMLFLLEMLAGAVVVMWMQRSGRIAALAAHLSPRTVAFISRAARVVALAFAFALLAGGLGFMQLARVVGGAVLGSGYAAMLLFALQRLGEGAWAYALRTQALGGLHAVQRHRALLQHRGERLLTWVASAAWIVATLESAELREPVWHIVHGLLTSRFTAGTFSISLGDVVAFVVTVWLSFLLSRFARFVLEEDIYSRLRLTRGLPYAFSSILHYLILLVGFFVALAATGLQLDRFALLAGAFSVGIGFGLQTIVNNFVSGLILLFERPVQVGDTVQIGTLTGEIRRIGPRASVVRTFDGADVIVPNSQLIADAVTNWTLSDRLRRIEITVPTAAGSDADDVLALLLDIAAAHPLVLQQPPPSAVLDSIGNSTLTFILRAWTDRFEQWGSIRSELLVAIERAFREKRLASPPPAGPAPPAPP
ncbi:MAG: mechanosensitive ion channel domain-containing protein, partial [Candidatus Binatia bacterium]